MDQRTVIEDWNARMSFLSHQKPAWNTVLLLQSGRIHYIIKVLAITNKH